MAASMIPVCPNCNRRDTLRLVEAESGAGMARLGIRCDACGEPFTLAQLPTLYRDAATWRPNR